jgi:hypothetical protein
MLRSAFLLVFWLFMACTATAAQKFSCGGAEADISVIGRESPMWERRAEAVVSVSKDGYSTVLRYRNIDFIGGECVSVENSKPLVVFQAYCGGSGCKDGNNWGIIETEFLRVLTVPSDSNSSEAKKIIGNQPLPALKMISVLDEARTLGIQVPHP